MMDLLSIMINVEGTDWCCICKPLHFRRRGAPNGVAYANPLCQLVGTKIGVAYANYQNLASRAPYGVAYANFTTFIRGAPHGVAYASLCESLSSRFEGTAWCCICKPLPCDHLHHGTLGWPHAASDRMLSADSGVATRRLLKARSVPLHACVWCEPRCLLTS